MRLGSEDLRHWLVPAVIALVAVVLQWVIGPEWLRLDREQAWSEPWRLFAAHFVHLGWVHLGLNLTGLLLLWLLLGDMLRPLWWVAGIAFMAVGVSLALLWCSPAVGWYVGFSGVLHGLFVAGAIANLRHLPGLAVPILVVLSLKLLVERIWQGGFRITELIGGNVIVDAHLYGALLGLCVGGLSLVASSRTLSLRR